MFKPILHRKVYTQILLPELTLVAGETFLDGMLAILDEADENREAEQIANSFAVSNFDALKKALIAGTVIYLLDKEEFHGTFNAAISKDIRGLNGQWRNHKYGYFSARSTDVPPEVLGVAAVSLAKRQDVYGRAESYLKAANENLAAFPMRLSLRKPLESISDDLRKQFDETVSGGGLWVSDVPEQVLQEAEDAITKAASGSVTASMKRAGIEMERAKERGYDVNELRDRLLEEKAMSRMRMRDIADQGASEFVAAVRQAIYKPAGLKSYVWITKEDERVRESHAALNRRVFDWDNPPITDLRTGRRCHPGQDANCRCVAIPTF